MIKNSRHKLYGFLEDLTTSQSMLSIVRSLPQAAILSSQLANIKSMRNIRSTNGAKFFLESLLASNIVYSKDNGIAPKCSQD